MSTFPGSPQVMKGAIVGLDPFNPLASVLSSSTTRTHSRARSRRRPSAAMPRGRGARLKGPPQETITLDIEIDATDQLERAQLPAAQLGIYPDPRVARDAALPEIRARDC